MSLIADALKRAQEQRQGGGQGSDAGARRLLTPSGPLRVPARKRRDVPRSLAVAGFALAAAVVVFAVVVVLSPRAEFRAATAWAAEAGNGGVGDLGDVGGMGAPGSTAGGQLDVIGPSGEEWADDERRSSEARVFAERAEGAGYPVEGVGGDWSGGALSGGESGETTGGRPSGTEVASSFRMALSGEPVVRDLVTRALGAQQAGDLVGAASLYRRALSSRPDDPQLHNNLGTVYRSLGMPGQAYDAFQKALAADGGYAPAWNNLGLMLEALGRTDEAVDAYHEAIRLDAENGGARVNLANLYHSMGLGREARGLLEAALRDDPRLPEAHYALARLLDAEGDREGARRHFTLFLNTGRGGFGALEARVREYLEGGED